MHIRSFHIDGFGIFSDLSVPVLSRGLNIFLGDNESGKSTCLDFFRFMLFGYPHHSSREASRTPLGGGQAGGTLVLETPRQGSLRLTRRPGKNGLKISDTDGNPLDPSLLDTIMGGVTRELYRNVFAFSLTELQRFETLENREVRDALYAAGFGTGLRSPAEILKELDKKLGEIFKPQGRNAPLNRALADWNDLAGKLRAAQEESARFDMLSIQRRENEEKLRALRDEQDACRIERRMLERRLGVWRQWEEWRRTGPALARLAPVAETFPPDGPARLERTKEKRDAAARRLHALEEELVRLKAERDSFVVNEDLRALAEELPLLAERKASYRNALGALPAQNAALARTDEELARLLRTLGPDWNCERIRATNRSLFTREELERQTREMDAAVQFHNAAAIQLQRADSEMENARHELALAETALEHLPLPAAGLDEAHMENLRGTLPRLEEHIRRMPERKRALQAARSDANRSCAPLRLKAGAPENVPDLLVNAQEDAQKLADAVLERIECATTAKSAAELAQQAEENARLRKDRLAARLRETKSPSRGLLEAQSAALRNLRQVGDELARELSRLGELDEMLQRPAPAPVRNVFLLYPGLALIAAGFGLLLARWQFGVTELAFSPELAFPVSLWSGYLVVLAGVGLLAGGLPRSSPEIKLREEEDRRLREKREHTLRRIAELEEQAQHLGSAAGIAGSPPTSDAVDEAEALLLEEREKFADAERLRREMDSLQAEHAELHENASRLEKECRTAERAVQQARQGWHSCLEGFHVETIPSPEAAAAFFARVEAARLARAGVANLERELRDVTEQCDALIREARAVPSVAALLSDAATGEEALPEEARLHAVVAAVRRVLDECRETFARTEDRAEASAAVRTARMHLARAESARDESAAKLDEARLRLDAARAAWSGSLAGLGLDVELSPGTVRDALECMERCLGAEAETARLRDETARLEAECDALRLPVQELYRRLRREAPSGGDDRPDWPAALTLLMRESAAAARTFDERETVTRRISEQETALRAAETNLKDEERAHAELLALAGAVDTEEFLRCAAIRAEREALVRRRQDLEDTLRLAADTLTFEEFTAEFGEFDEAEQKARLTALNARMEEQEKDERGLVDALGAVHARLGALEEAAGELAALRQEEASLREMLHRLRLDFGRLSLAKELIAGAKQNFERRSQPAVIRAASSLFAEITEGAWQGIGASLDAGSLSVFPPHKEAVAPERLSRGAQEQLYLALRLAYIRNHAGQAAALPVIMDDILVNFDPGRARRTAAVLAPLVRGTPPENGADAIPPHQVLFFTCHPSHAEMLREAAPDSLLHLADKGRISTQ